MCELSAGANCRLLHEILLHQDEACEDSRSRVERALTSSVYPGKVRLVVRCTKILYVHLVPLLVTSSIAQYFVTMGWICPFGILCIPFHFLLVCNTTNNCWTKKKNRMTLGLLQQTEGLETQRNIEVDT